MGSKTIRCDRGFTLVELMVIMVIIATVAAIALPSFQSWLPNLKMKAAARDLFSKMQEIRLLAIKENSGYAISFNVANNSYSIMNDWGNDGIPESGDAGEGDGNFNAATETYETITLTDYGSGVTFGTGAATDDVPGNGWPSGPVSYAGAELQFDNRGLGTSGYVYITNQNNVQCMAVGTLTSGAVKMLRSLGGTVWD